jgi:hypothetical protein
MFFLAVAVGDWLPRALECPLSQETTVAACFAPSATTGNTTSKRSELGRTAYEYNDG